MDPCPQQRRLVSGVWLLSWALLPAATAAAQDTKAVRNTAGRAGDDRPDPVERIRYYEARVAESPELYPALARLGEAYLDRARASHDPRFLTQARAALERSIAIQTNAEALKTMTAVCTYSHRFADALRWARRAAEAHPEDRGITALQVEAHLALGQVDEAGALLSGASPPATSFHDAAARGTWLAAQGRAEEAASSFLQAAERAEAQKARDLAVWARVSSAGVWIDAGKPERARPLLDAVARTDPDDALLQLHQAELHEAEGRPEAALAAYEALLVRGDDPEIHRRAFTLARQLGRRDVARRHFEAAEASFLKAIDAGEVYTLEALARLYLDAKVHPDRALDLARRNLEYKRDRAAHAVLNLARGPQDSP
jgi:tetratricopeptide (TPR) repeat protein